MLRRSHSPKTCTMTTGGPLRVALRTSLVWGFQLEGIGGVRHFGWNVGGEAETAACGRRAGGGGAGLPGLRAGACRSTVQSVYTKPQNQTPRTAQINDRVFITPRSATAVVAGDVVRAALLDLIT